MSRQAWEYTWLRAQVNQIEAFTGGLNEHGAEGWELVGFASGDKTVGLNVIMAILKRPRVGLEPMPAGTEEGWYPDPGGRHPDRYWDGARWGRFVRDKPGGTRLEDPPYADA